MTEDSADDAPADPVEFQALPRRVQERIRAAAREAVLMAQRKTVPVIIAPPPSVLGEFNSASGSLVRFGGDSYLATADHVIDKYEKRRASEGNTVLQVGDAVLTLDGRHIWRDSEIDAALVRLTVDEVNAIAVPPDSAPNGWPPPLPAVGDYVLVAGYPKIGREQLGPAKVFFKAMSARFHVTAVGNHHLICQWERTDFINFGGPEIPEPGTDLGGLSGGPVFLERRLSYPLVGVISQFQEGFELLRVALFAGASDIAGETDCNC